MVVHSSSTDKKLESKLNALVSLVTQLANNEKSASLARLSGICPSSDHYIDACPSLQQPVGPDAPQAYVANIYNNRSSPQQQ